MAKATLAEPQGATDQKILICYCLSRRFFATALEYFSFYQAASIGINDTSGNLYLTHFIENPKLLFSHLFEQILLERLLTAWDLSKKKDLEMSFQIYLTRALYDGIRPD